MNIISGGMGVSSAASQGRDRGDVVVEPDDPRVVKPWAAVRVASPDNGKTEKRS